MAAVTLVERYNPEWPQWFKTIKAFLGETIIKTCLCVEHVGSTSIPGMTAKPIIDIDLVTAPQDWETIKVLLEQRGYRHQGDLGIKDRESFDLCGEALKAALPAHHLYVCPAHSAELRRHIAFREYLKTHKRDRERLSELKWSLAEAFANDKFPYMDGKDTLVKEILEKALKYYQKR